MLEVAVERYAFKRARMNRLLPIFLITTGSFLEIFYYAFRFTSDGIPTWLAIIIGAALTALLAAVTVRRRSPAAIGLIVLLAAYSIFCTSAGQAFSLGVELNERQEEQVNQANINDELEEIRIDVSRLNNEYDALQSQINATVTTLENRYEWKNTLARAEERQATIKEELSALKDRRAALRASQTTRQDVEKVEQNIYVFYAVMFGWDRNWLQFALQTILSAFIALMAPFGIIMLGSKPKTRQAINWAPMVEKWVERNWIGVRGGHEKPRIIKWEIFSKQIPNFPSRKYLAIKKAAYDAKCIDKRGNILNNDEEKSIKKILRRLEGVKIRRKQNGKLETLKDRERPTGRVEGGEEKKDRVLQRRQRGT